MAKISTINEDGKMARMNAKHRKKDGENKRHK